MDLEGVASQATPGLIAEITREYPSFPQQWVDDRVRTLATVYLLQKKKPDLLLVHLIDLDSDSHDRGPFEGESKATLERTDDLIRQMQAAAKPAGYRIVITSDHGFERIDRVVNIRARAAREGITGDLQIVGSLVVTKDAAVAAWLARLAGDKGSGVGRAVAREELLRFAPAMTEAVAAYEPPAHMTFGGAADGPLEAPPREKGEHGLWPGRPDYRSTYLLWGPGIAPAKLPQISMLDIKDRLAAAMALACPTRLQ
jgi:predicted AlkP superfamily pyrophosphatase or phosphodiesterase